MREKLKLVIVFIIGIMISVVISVYAQTLINATEVSYTDNKSIGASNTQDAIDSVYTSANSLASNVTAIKNLYGYSGAIFITASSSVTTTMLSNAFGGTWEAYGQGRTLIGVGSNGTTNYTLGSTGGSENHRHYSPLTYYEKNGTYVGSTNRFGFETGITNSFYGAQTTKSLGTLESGSTAITYYTSISNHMMPYAVVYIYKRK